MEIYKGPDPSFDHHIYQEVSQPHHQHLNLNASSNSSLQSHVLRHQQNVQNILINMDRNKRANHHHQDG